MQKVVLYDYKSSDMNVNVFAEFEADGSLRVDGCDAGGKVKRMWGDYDYEYIITVTPEHLPSLYKALDTTQEKLLKLMLEKFGGDRAFSKFKKYLEARDIPFDFFTWV